MRFVNCVCHPVSDHLAAVDAEGGIMIIQAPQRRYWILPEIGRITSMGFSLYLRNYLIVANSFCHLLILNIELGELGGILEGHTSPANSISFTMDHRYCLSASRNEAIVWDLATKKMKQKLNMQKEINIKMAIFLPLKGQILACFQDDSLHVWNFGSYSEIFWAFPKHIKSNDIKSLALTRNGKLLAVGGFHSAIILFNLEKWKEQEVFDLPHFIGGIKYLEFMPPEKGANKQNLKDSLDLKRLVPILKQFGIYPDEYRTVIWKSLMQVPNNRGAFLLLANQPSLPGVPSCRIQNKHLQNRCNRVLSALAHHAPILAQTEFLSFFVFPFVKTFENDLVAAFEVVYTILKNWCQYWWLSFPFAPYRVLDLLQKIMKFHEPKIHTHFQKCRVGPELFAWTLLQSAFSEVLKPCGWHQLWDHILSNEPAFFLFATIAYNSVTFPLHKSLTTYKEYEEFFSQQNIINMKRFLSKTYYFLNHTPKSIHPRKILKTFKSLDKEVYDSFDQFPEFIEKYKDIHLSNLNHILEIKKNHRDLSLAFNVRKSEKVKEKLHKEENVKNKVLEESYYDLLAKDKANILSSQKTLLNLSEDLCESKSLSSSVDSTSNRSREIYKKNLQMLPKLYKKIDVEKTLFDLEQETNKFLSHLKN